MVIINNKIIRFSMSNVQDLNDTLPTGVWLVKYDQSEGEYYLERQDEFKMPKKVYGDTNTLATRYLNTFNKGDKNLGVALTGLKGTGKSLLAKKICIDSGFPVIIITDAFFGSDFSAFISTIKQDAIIFIDEFEKVYAVKEKQENFLSILDGVFMGKKLFLFTSNETSKYSNYLINRPGRVHYMKEFERISDEILDDILNTNLKNKKDIPQFKEIMNMIEDANIDMVFALVNECNLYKETPKEAVEYLNIKITTDASFTVSIYDLGNQKTYEGFLNNSPMINRYGLGADMTDESYSSLTSKEQDDTKKYPYTKNFIVNLSKCEVKQDGREFIIISDKFIMTAKPNKAKTFRF